MNIEMALPAGVRDLCACLHTAGYQTVVAGGAVRDHLLGMPPHDWDVATAATPTDVRRVLTGVEFYTTPTAQTHGNIVALLEDGQQVEITTFRQDVACDGRHATVAFASTVEADLARRDFTVNALAWEPATGRLYGPDDGNPGGALRDLEQRVVRFVGDPVERIRQDKTRLLRGPYLEGKLGGELEPASLQAIVEAVGTREWWRQLKFEAVRDNLFKSMALPGAGKILRRWDEVGLLAAYFPELVPLQRLLQNAHHDPEAFDDRQGRLHTTVWAHTLLAVDQAQRPELPFPFVQVPYFERDLGLGGYSASWAMLRWALLWHDAGKADTWGWKSGYGFTFHGHGEHGADIVGPLVLEAPGRRAKWPMDQRLARQLLLAVHEHDRMPQPDWSPAAIRRWARDIGYENVEWLLAVRAADWGAIKGLAGQVPGLVARVRQAVAETGPTRASAPLITGHDVMEHLGLGPGPQVRAALEKVQAYLDEHPAAGRAELLAVLPNL